jgi:pimeloyl-ACP methyl ester carboxylesterase
MNLERERDEPPPRPAVGGEVAATSTPSSDGVDVATFDLGGRGPTLLISHATGFHGRCYLPLATALADRFHSVTFDYRGHGDTPRPAGVPFVWPRIADDVVAVAAALDTPVAAFGHSMGGACLLLAAHRDPGLFRGLVLFEPIVFPPDPQRQQPSPMSVGARRRRPSFPSYAAAQTNFAAKPPLNAFTPEALEAYVRFGFAPGPDGVHLKCAPDDEADTFDAAMSSGAWDVLAEIDVPTMVVCGRADGLPPRSFAAAVAERLPKGRYLELPELDHFAPMTHPALVAEVVAEALA